MKINLKLFILLMEKFRFSRLNGNQYNGARKWQFRTFYFLYVKAFGRLYCSMFPNTHSNV